MSYLRPVQPLIAALITDLPDAQASAGLKDAIIFVEEDGSVRRWDVSLQQWTRRGGPVIPLPMSSISPPVKAISTGNRYSSTK